MLSRTDSPSTLFYRDPNTIFRGNSLTSKCIDETMKLAGMHYLHVTLKPAIEEVSGGPTPWPPRTGHVRVSGRPSSAGEGREGRSLPRTLRADGRQL